MKTRIQVVMAVTLLATLFVLPQPCAACSCVAMTRPEMITSAQLIFRGTVIEQGEAHALIQVDTLWKGTLPASIVKVERGERGTSSASCTISYTHGVSYVVLAHERSDSDILDSGTCSGTGLVTATEVVSRFGPGVAIENTNMSTDQTPPQATEANTQRSESWIWIITGAATVLVAGAVVWHRRSLNKT